MKKLWILLVIAIILLFIRFREGFEATTNIKDPATWNAAEIDRIKGMVTPKSTEPDDAVKSVVGGFWRVWKEASSQISPAQINTYLDNNSIIQGAQNKRQEYFNMIHVYYVTQYLANQMAGFDSLPNNQRNTNTNSNVTRGPPQPATEIQGTSNSTLNVNNVSTRIKKPSTNDTHSMDAVHTFVGIPRNDITKINFYITKLVNIYDTIYMPNKNIPTENDIKNYIEQNMNTDEHKTGFTALVHYWFNSHETKEGNVSITSTTGGSSGSLFGASSKSPTQQTDNPIFGPIFTGTGSLTNPQNATDTSKTNNYPKLIGGMVNPTNTGRLDGVGMIKPTLPFQESVVPGDLDFIPDPFRVSLTYTPSSYSSGKDPIPFLTDFSAFQR